MLLCAKFWTPFSNKLILPTRLAHQLIPLLDSNISMQPLDLSLTQILFEWSEMRSGTGSRHSTRALASLAPQEARVEDHGFSLSQGSSLRPDPSLFFSLEKCKVLGELICWSAGGQVRSSDRLQTKNMKPQQCSPSGYLSQCVKVGSELAGCAPLPMWWKQIPPGLLGRQGHLSGKRGLRWGCLSRGYWWLR